MAMGRDGDRQVSQGQDRFGLNTKMRWGLLAAKAAGVALFGVVLTLLPFG